MSLTAALNSVTCHHLRSMLQSVLAYVTMVTVSTVTKTIPQYSIHSQIMFTNYKATLVRNNKTSVQCLNGGID